MHRILVVDHDAPTQRELEEVGFETRAPTPGENVLQLVSSWRPALVILAIGGRDSGGLQLLRHITDLDPHVLTVLVSEHLGYSDDFAAWLADAFVVRKGDGFELRQTVQRLLAEPLSRDRMIPPCA